MTEEELQRLANQQLAALKVTLAMLDQVRGQDRMPNAFGHRPAHPRRPKLRVIRGGAA